MKTNKEKQNKSPEKVWVEFSQIGIQMAISIAAGVYLGVWLDEKYPNKYKAFSIICSLVAVFASLYLVIKKVMNLSNKENKKKE